MTVPILLANQAFSLGMSDKDKKRRQAFFGGDKKNALMPVELDILKKIGIDAIMMRQLQPYLADFFNALPNCQSDSQVLLNHTCEIVYHVIWSALFAGYHEGTKRLDAYKPRFTPARDIDVAIFGEMTHNLRPGTGGDANLIFTLILGCVPEPSAVIRKRGRSVSPLGIRMDTRSRTPLPLPSGQTPLPSGQSSIASTITGEPVTHSVLTPSGSPPVPPLSTDGAIDRLFTPVLACP